MISPSESDRISLGEDPGSEQPAGNSHQKNFWRGKNGFEKFSSPKKFLRDSAQPSLSQHQASIPLPFLICISDLPHHNKNNLGKRGVQCSLEPTVWGCGPSEQQSHGNRSFGQLVIFDLQPRGKDHRHGHLLKAMTQSWLMKTITYQMSPSWCHLATE